MELEVTASDERTLHHCMMSAELISCQILENRADLPTKLMMSYGFLDTKSFGFSIQGIGSVDKNAFWI